MLQRVSLVEYLLQGVFSCSNITLQKQSEISMVAGENSTQLETSPLQKLQNCTNTPTRMGAFGSSSILGPKSIDRSSSMSNSLRWASTNASTPLSNQTTVKPMIASCL